MFLRSLKATSIHVKYLNISRLFSTAVYERVKLDNDTLKVEKLESNLDSKEFIEKIVNENDVVVFMKGTIASPMCGFSRVASQILQIEGVSEIVGVNVLDNQEVREQVKKYSSWPTIPQIFIAKEFIGGSDILYSMYQSGELSKLLKEKSIELVKKEEANQKP